MGNARKHEEEKLAARIAAYEAISGDKKGFRKPGSTNRKKQWPNAVGKQRRF